MTIISAHNLFFDPNLETLPRAQIERMQEVRILRLIDYVYHKSPLINHIWDMAGVKPGDIRNLQEYKEKAPFIDKDKIRAFRDGHNDPFGGLNCSTAPHLRHIGFTSGTTGDPTPIPHARNTPSIVDLQRGLWHLGMRPNDYMIYMMFTFREGSTASRIAEAGFRPICFPYDPSAVVPRLIEASLKYRPKVMFMLSTPLITAMEKYMRDHRIDAEDVFSSYSAGVFGGEPLGKHMNQRVKDWGLELFEYSACGDISGALECSAHNGMHTWEDLVLLENLDPYGNQPVADGEVGELVVTSLMDDVAPMVRFRTDDLVKITREPCSCGRTHARMWPMGRKSDQIIVKGKSILPRDILPLLQPLKETYSGLFQIILKSREAEELSLRIGYDTSVTNNTTELEQTLKQLLEKRLEVPVSIELVTDDELLKLGPPQKIPRVTKQ